VIKAAPLPNKKIQCGDNPLHELGALQHLSKQPQENSHVIRLLDAFEDEVFLYMVMPYLSGGDLFSKLEEEGSESGLPEMEVATYIKQTAEGLAFMRQTSGLAHHDLSLENIMLSSKQKGVATIIDLGMCLRVPMVEESEPTEDGDEEEGKEAKEDEEKKMKQKKQQQVMLCSQPCCGKAGSVVVVVVVVAVAVAVVVAVVVVVVVVVCEQQQ